MNMTLPTDSAERKDYPLLSGALRYAPASFALMAAVAKRGNDKHNPGMPLHHARWKSADHGDCVLRHMVDIQDIEAHVHRTFLPDELVDRNDLPPELVRLADELGQFAWRANMYVQMMAERYLGAPKAPAARDEGERP